MTDPSQTLDRVAKAILNDYFAQYPQEAVAAGVHDFDGRISELGPGTLEDWGARLGRQAAALAEIDKAGLDPGRRLDLSVLSHAVALEQHKLEDRRLFRRSPMDVVALLDPTLYLKRSYAPLVDRVASMTRHLGQVPRVLAEARARLEPPLPVPDVDTARKLLAGTARLMETGLGESIAPLEGTADGLLDSARQAAADAAEAVDSFGKWLGSLHENGETTQEFALGETVLTRMLGSGEAVYVPLDTIVAIGEEDLARNQRALAAVAQALDPDAEPAATLRAADGKSPAPASLVATTEAAIAELAEFFQGHGLVEVPEGGTLIVEETPPHLRWAFAWLSAPGAFENAEESYFYVTPPEPEWDQPRQDEWMTKFAPGRLRMVSIHEAYPGHFVHHLHVRRIESGVRRFFGAYSAWEAWAHYSEQLTVEAGFRPEDLSLRLAQLAEALVRNVRLLAAVGLHSRGMTVADAAALFQKHAHLAPAAAKSEALRGTFDPGYMNYTLGKLMLLKLREDSRAAARAAGETFNLRRFHDEYLSYGPAPVPLVREAMLGQDAGSPL